MKDIKVARYSHEYCIDRGSSYRLTHIDIEPEHLIEFLQLKGFDITMEDVVDIGTADDDSDRDWMITLEGKPVVVMTEKYPSQLR